MSDGDKYQRGKDVGKCLGVEVGRAAVWDLVSLKRRYMSRDLKYGESKPWRYLSKSCQRRVSSEYGGPEAELLGYSRNSKEISLVGAGREGEEWQEMR